MADFDSADLLERFKEAAGISDASEDTTTALYRRLSTAQATVIREIAARYPNCLYQSPTALTPASDRKTFTFGTHPNDPTRNIVPLGWVQISPRLTAFVGDTSALWEVDRDFLDEGDQIRIPGDRTYSGTLYGRWVPTPPTLSASVQPILKDDGARALVVVRATMDYSGEGDANRGVREVAKEQWGLDFPVVMLALRRRFRGGGGLVDPARWYFTSPDLGSA